MKTGKKKKALKKKQKILMSSSPSGNDLNSIFKEVYGDALKNLMYDAQLFGTSYLVRPVPEAPIERLKRFLKENDYKKK